MTEKHISKSTDKGDERFSAQAASAADALREEADLSKPTEQETAEQVGQANVKFEAREASSTASEEFTQSLLRISSYRPVIENMSQHEPETYKGFIATLQYSLQKLQATAQNMGITANFRVSDNATPAEIQAVLARIQESIAPRSAA